MQNVTLLLADDDVSSLEFLSYLCEERDWKVVTTTSASGIIEEMNSDIEFDAIIADVNYFDNQPGPRLTGITAARQIRKVHPQIPIIFVTAYANSIMREEVRRVNAEIMPKPVNGDTLLNRVNELIYWHRASGHSYKGPERRTSGSVNRSEYHRRASDIHITTSPIVKQVIEEVKKKANEQ